MRASRASEQRLCPAFFLFSSAQLAHGSAIKNSYLLLSTYHRLKPCIQGTYYLVGRHGQEHNQNKKQNL